MIILIRHLLLGPYLKIAQSDLSGYNSNILAIFEAPLHGFVWQSIVWVQSGVAKPIKGLELPQLADQGTHRVVDTMHAQQTQTTQNTKNNRTHSSYRTQRKHLSRHTPCGDRKNTLMQSKIFFLPSLSTAQSITGSQRTDLCRSYSKFGRPHTNSNRANPHKPIDG